MTTTRNPFTAPEGRSRRGGPVKKPLSRDAIVEAGLALLVREGLTGLSLRRVAAALDTGPAALYVYVANLQELQALVCDRALAGVVTRGAGGRAPWRKRLEALLRSYFDVLSRTPGLASLALNTIAAGPNALRILDTFLGLLAEAGVDAETAAWGVDLLSLYVTAIAAEQSQRKTQPDPLGPTARSLEEVTAAQYPNIHAARAFILSGKGRRFDWAIEALLRGIMATPSRFS